MTTKLTADETDTLRDALNLPPDASPPLALVEAVEEMLDGHRAQALVEDSLGSVSGARHGGTGVA